MYKISAFLTKRADIFTDDFIDHYKNHHIPLVISLSGDTLPPLYKCPIHLTGFWNRHMYAAVGPQIDFDVVTELGFADEAAWLRALRKDGGGEKIVENEGRFLNMNRARGMVVEEFATGG